MAEEKKSSGRRPATRFWLWSEQWLLGSTRTELSNEERAVFVDFLCLAAMKGGCIECYSRKQLASQLCIEEDLLDQCIDKFIKSGKIQRKYFKREKKEIFYVQKWEQYQPEYLWKNPCKLTRKKRSTKEDKNDAYVDTIREEKREEEKKKEDSSETSPQKISDTDIRLTNLLIEKILENDSKSSVQRMTQKTKEAWLNECRKLREIDDRTPDEIEAVICWCQEDDFEKTVVLSMPKLRKRFDELWLKFEKANINKDSNQRRRIKDNGRNKLQTYVGSQQLWTKEEEKKYLPMIDKEYEENLHAYMEKEGITNKEDVDPFKVPTLTDFRVEKLNEIRRKISFKSKWKK